VQQSAATRKRDDWPDAALRVADPPQTTWWVQIRNARGQVGWTDESEHSAALTPAGDAYPLNSFTRRGIRGSSRPGW